MIGKAHLIKDLQNILKGKEESGADGTSVDIAITVINACEDKELIVQYLAQYNLAYFAQQVVAGNYNRIEADSEESTAQKA